MGIVNDNFNIASNKVLVDYAGNLIEPYDSNYWTYGQIWNKSYKVKYNNLNYNYYPRGRVVIKNGKAWINLPREIYLPQIIDKVVKEYSLNNLQINYSAKDDSNINNHYYFELK